MLYDGDDAQGPKGTPSKFEPTTTHRGSKVNRSARPPTWYWHPPLSVNFVISRISRSSLESSARGRQR